MMTADFARFDHLIVMDRINERALIDLGAPRAKIQLLLSFHPKPPSAEVPDPYYGGPHGFESMYEMIDGACRGLIEAILHE